MKSQSTTIANYLRAGYSGLYLLSYEERRVQAVLRAAIAMMETPYTLHVWTITKGIASFNGNKIEFIENTEDAGEALAAFDKLPKNMNGSDCGHVLLMQDLHLFCGDPGPVLIRRLKESLDAAKRASRYLVVLGCQLKLAPELEKEFTVIEFKLPDKEQLRIVLENVAGEAKIKLNGQTDAILDSASGLTCIEAENAFALSVVEKKDIVPDVVYREKASTIKKNGILEIVESKVTLDEIGGLENLKAHLFGIRNNFTQEAKDYGLPSPRPVLACGQAGTGKSLVATACGNIFNLPLLKLEAGRLFGSLVGESERNWRSAFATAKAIAPVVLWCDEIDGLFSGGESSGRTDGGTTQRVIKAILQDMQFNSEGIFFVFTANDIDQLPDPLIDRCDVWSVDLPTQTEREVIWKIHIAKRNRKPGKYDLKELGRLSEGFSGRQIEQAWIAAMTWAFNQKMREPNDADCKQVLECMVPTSKTMAEAIERRRKRLQGKARPASRVEAETLPSGHRKLTT